MSRPYKVFELKKEHLELLKHASVEMNDSETGAPGIDPKRPYGNSSVASDVAEILGLPPLDSDDVNYRERRDELLRLHHETLEALQIILELQTFELGMYQQVARKHPYDLHWERVK